MPCLPRFAIYALLSVLAGAAGCVEAPSAMAAEKAAGTAAGAGVGAESARPADAGADPVVAMSADDCRRLLIRLGAGSDDILHRPDPGVNYQPGRDVDSQGRPVAPADLPGSNPLPLNHLLTLDVRIPLSTLLGDRTPPKVGWSKLHVAEVTVDPMSGQLMFDGRPLEGAPEDAVAAACRKELQKPRKP